MEGYGLAANDLFGLVKSSRGHWVVVISISNLPDQKESRFPAIRTPDSLCLCSPNTDFESAENNSSSSFHHFCDFECASRAAIPELSQRKLLCIPLPTKPALCRSILSLRHEWQSPLRNPPQSHKHPGLHWAYPRPPSLARGVESAIGLSAIERA